VQGFIDKKARPEIFNLKPYVPGKPIDEVKRELGLEDVIKLASNENPLGPSPLGVQAIKDTLDSLHIYPDGNCFNLKRKLADYLQVPTDHLLIGNGSDEILMMIAQTFINRDDEVIYASPSFSEYEFTVTVMGGKCIAVPVENFKHNLEAMAAAVTDKTKIIYICNPNNPTGTIVSKEETEAFLSKIPEDVLVVFDEAYYEYVEAEDYPDSLEYVRQGKNVIVCRTFSKIYGLAALRAGYAITAPEIAAAVERVIEPFNVNTLAQIGAAAALDDQTHLAASKEVNKAGKDYLYAQFSELGLKYVPTEANFIFVDTGKDCREVFKQLLALGVIVRTGDIFGYPTYLRVTIGNSSDNERFIKSLKQVLGK
jgi:histidinol-phosphate aminotransferase